MCKYLNIMRAELLWSMYFPYNSPVDPLFTENNSRELIPDLLDWAETFRSSTKINLLYWNLIVKIYELIMTSSSRFTTENWRSLANNEDVSLIKLYRNREKSSLLNL